MKKEKQKKKIKYSDSEFLKAALPEDDGSNYLPFGTSIQDIRESCEENKQ